jgi:hypothetical protein
MITLRYKNILSTPNKKIRGKEQTEQSHRISKKTNKFLSQIASLKLKMVKTGNQIQSHMINLSAPEFYI